MDVEVLCQYLANIKSELAGLRADQMAFSLDLKMFKTKLTHNYEVMKAINYHTQEVSDLKAICRQSIFSLVCHIEKQ